MGPLSKKGPKGWKQGRNKRKELREWRKNQLPRGIIWSATSLLRYMLKQGSGPNKDQSPVWDIFHQSRENELWILEVLDSLSNSRQWNTNTLKVSKSSGFKEFFWFRPPLLYIRIFLYKYSFCFFLHSWLRGYIVNHKILSSSLLYQKNIVILFIFNIGLWCADRGGPVWFEKPRFSLHCLSIHLWILMSIYNKL